MPVVDPNEAVNAAGAKTARRNARKAASETSAGDGTTPLSEVQMLNLPQAVVIRGLPFTFVTPVIKDASEIERRIYSEWPDIFIYAAVGEREGVGISPDVVVEWAQKAQETYRPRYLAQCEKDGIEPEDAVVFTRQSVADALRAIPDDIVTSLCPTIWALASQSPNLRWPHPIVEEGVVTEPLPPGVEWLDEAITARFTKPGLVDICRALLDCLGGYPGDAADRFL